MFGRILYAAVLCLLAISPWVAAEDAPIRPMVVYVFHDTGLDYQLNLKFFLKFGIQPDVDYFIVVNGPSLLPISVADTPNVQVLRRENYGYDFQAWGTALTYAMKQRAYTHFLFLNGSLRGPYHKNWLQSFFQPLSETVKAVGMTLNCPDWFDRPVVHIQSMVWATDLVGLNVLLDGGLLSTLTKEEAYNGESQIGLLLRDAGFQITSLQNIHLGLPPPATLVQCDREYTEIWSVSPINDLPSTAVYPFIKTKYLPYRNAILVSDTASLTAASFRLTEVALALQKMGVLVEVAAPGTGALTDVLSTHGIPCHKLTGVSAQDQASEVRQLHVGLAYAIAIWNGAEYSLPSVASATPGAHTTLWVHSDVSDANVAALQQFQFVWFANTKAATAASVPLYPRGHLPLGFRVVPGFVHASLSSDMTLTDLGLEDSLVITVNGPLTRSAGHVALAGFLAEALDAQSAADVHLVVLGDCGEADACAAVRTASPRLKLRIMGSQPLGKMWLPLSMSDLHISLSDSPIAPIDALKAWQAGVPVMADALGGYPEEVAVEAIALTDRALWVSSLSRKMHSRMAMTTRRDHRQAAQAAAASVNAQTTGTLAALLAAARGDTGAAYEVSPLARALCPASSEARVAVAAHLGVHDPNRLQALLEAFRGTSAHIWVTHFHRSQSPAIQTLADAAGLTVYPMLVRNKGLDVGPFFLTLAQIQACRLQYAYLLKYHYKTGEGFMQSAAHQMLSHQTVEHALTAFNQNPQLALAYPSEPSSKDDMLIRAAGPEFLMANAQWIGQISAELKLPPMRFFVAGTVWMVRANALLHTLKDVPTIMTQYSRLIETDSIDWRWYSRNIRSSTTKEEALAHYLQEGQVLGLPGHCYAPGWVGNRDGMVEHAWERLFGAMLSADGEQFVMALHSETQPKVEKLSFHTQAVDDPTSNITEDVTPTEDTTYDSTAIVASATVIVQVNIVVTYISATTTTLTGTGDSAGTRIESGGKCRFNSPGGTDLLGTYTLEQEDGGTTENTGEVRLGGSSKCNLARGHSWWHFAPIRVAVTLPSFLAMDILGDIISLSNQCLHVSSGRVKCSEFCRILTCLRIGTNARRLASQRKLLQATTTGTVEECGLIGSGSVIISSGGLLSRDTSCSYTDTVITDSTGATLTPVSSTTATNVTTSVTFESESEFSLLSVSSSSGIVNINGLLTMASDSTLRATLTSTATSAFSVNLIRYETDSCVVPPAQQTIADCGSFNCAFVAVAESSTFCIIQLQVTASDNTSDDTDSGLLGLLGLLAIIPLALGAGFLVWYLARDNGEAGLATQYTYTAADGPKATENWTPAPTPLGRF